jgi:hypothetical protein
MNSSVLIAVLDRAAPGFRSYSGSAENLFPQDTVHGVFAACSTFVREHPVTARSWSALATIVNEIVEGEDDDSRSAVCTCFLENLARAEHPLAPFLGSAALEYWRHWEHGD